VSQALDAAWICSLNDESYRTEVPTPPVSSFWEDLMGIESRCLIDLRSLQRGMSSASLVLLYH
jgi:hypothetical protein